VHKVCEQLGVSQRRACRVLGQHRSVERYAAKRPADEDALTSAIIALASRFGRYGYRRITALLEQAGWHINHKRVERIWQREGLKVPQKQPKRGRLWLTDGSCIRLRPEHANHVWAYDFVQDRTHDGKAFRMLTIVDEFTRESLAIVVERRLNSYNVIDAVADLIIQRGPPQFIRSDNGPELCSKAVRGWLGRVGVGTLFIEPDSPWENGYIESFNGKFRDELLDREIFYILKEAKILIEQWRYEYNTIRPHSSLGYRPPAPEAVAWPHSVAPTAQVVLN
jgi:transposase InsO family protein